MSYRVKFVVLYADDGCVRAIEYGDAGGIVSIIAQIPYAFGFGVVVGVPWLEHCLLSSLYLFVDWDGFHS